MRHDVGRGETTPNHGENPVYDTFNLLSSLVGFDDVGIHIPCMAVVPN